MEDDARDLAGERQAGVLTGAGQPEIQVLAGAGQPEIRVLAGTSQPETAPWKPFAEPVMDFLNQLSLRIRSERQQYEELAAFGFWCRKAHLEEFEKRYKDGKVRLGLGNVFHIPASNVPLLFAYSLVMGLLAGNSCTVRLSSGIQDQDLVLCSILEDLLKSPGYEPIRKRISVFSCPRKSPLIRELAARCDGCVVWGGDRTIQEIRSLPMKPEGVVLGFPDRYSLCILDTKQVGALSEDERNRLIHCFYNDTYVLDQNACSSPGWVIWNQKEETEETKNIRARWWEGVAKKARSYPMTPHKATVKYERLCRYAMTSDTPWRITRHGNRLYTIETPRIPGHPEQFRGMFGMFFETVGDWRELLRKMASSQLQTVTYHGIEEQEIIDDTVNHHLPGVRRIVAVGRAGEMDLIWDGQDVIEILSRQIGREV